MHGAILTHLSFCLQVAVLLMNTTATVGIVWLWEPMALPGNRLTRGRSQCWTQLCPQVCDPSCLGLRWRWLTFSVAHGGRTFLWIEVREQ